MFGAYLHARPTGAVFYVGKGRAKRALSLSARNPYHGSIIQKYKKENIIVRFIECSNEETAFELEKGLIKCFRKMGSRLANITNGGEGTSGLVHSLETKAKISLRSRNNQHNLGGKQSQEACEQIRQANKQLIWVHRDLEQKRVVASALMLALEQGWVKGRPPGFMVSISAKSALKRNGG